MKTYTLQDGGKITASSPSDFVTRLREGSRFDSECTNDEFMERFSERYKMFSGKDVSTESPALFLQGLLDTGYAKLI